MKMLKRILFLAILTAIFVTIGRKEIAEISTQKTNSVSFNDLSENYRWASEAVRVLTEKGAISGIEENVFSPKAPVTREQFAKMATLALNLDTSPATAQSYLDVDAGRWSFPYIEATKEYFPYRSEYAANEFSPEQICTREEVAATLANALQADLSAENISVLFEQYADAEQISSSILGQLAFACRNEILQGADGFLRPKDAVSRAEAAVCLYRAVCLQNNSEQNATDGATPIAGSSTVSLEKAKAWAKSRGAHERFLNIADIYWKYGKEMNIRPEVLYAQAAKETNFGKYTGNVVPEQNNWAGIKTKQANGDTTEDHESFSSPEDGVRAHFNHMSAYLGTQPKGKTHDRYAMVVSASWAGSIQYAEELGGHWAPDPSYGIDLVEHYLKPMTETSSLNVSNIPFCSSLSFLFLI